MEQLGAGHRQMPEDVEVNVIEDQAGFYPNISDPFVWSSDT